MLSVLYSYVDIDIYGYRHKIHKYTWFLSLIFILNRCSVSSEKIILLIAMKIDFFTLVYLVLYIEVESRCMLHYDIIAQINFLTESLIKAVKIPKFETKYLC